MYDDAALQYLYLKKLSCTKTYIELFEAFGAHTFRTERGREYNRFGFFRRLLMLRRTLKNIFDLIPPEVTNDPKTDILSDAEINLQCFIMNVFGCLDNLARTLVYENLYRCSDGKEIEDRHIGLLPSNRSVRRLLSKDFKGYLNSVAYWFVYLEEHRHAIAHRIPIYIPPYVQKESGEKIFMPVMTHSFNEASGLIGIHERLIDDWCKIEEIARRTLCELGAN